MCTVTWLRGVGRLELFTNRDEQRSRPPAEAPSERTSASGVRFLSPLDPAGGGTWVAASEHGLVLCLVNHYQARDPRGATLRSRGLIVTDLIDARAPEEVLERGASLPFDALRGFRLLALAPDRQPALLAWDGERVETARGDAIPLPLISSSVRLPEVERSRGALFARMAERRGAVDAALLDAFHRSEDPEPGPLSVSMTRDDASTVSHTRVVVESDEIAMHYAPGRPSERGTETVTRLTPSARGGA